MRSLGEPQSTLSSFQRWSGGLGGGGTIFWHCYEPLQKRNGIFFISPITTKCLEVELLVIRLAVRIV